MKVLLAVDERSIADAMAEFIVRCQCAPGTQFKVVHVIEPAPMAALAGPFAPELYQRFEHHRNLSARSRVMSIAMKLHASLPMAEVQELILRGDPRVKIPEIARQWGADLVVVGCRPRAHGLTLLGDVSRAIAADAEGSIVIVRAADDTSKAMAAETDDEDRESTGETHGLYASSLVDET